MDMTRHSAILIFAVLSSCGTGGSKGDGGPGDALPGLDGRGTELPDALGDGSSGDGVPVDVPPGDVETAGAAPDGTLDIVEAALLTDGVLQDVPADISDAADDAELAVPEVVPQDLVPAYQFPNQWGPFEVGVRKYQWFDMERMRLVPTTIWYPGIPGSQPKAKYLVLIEGNAYSNTLADTSGAPYPMVLFSHGFRGVAVQSVSFTEFIASHGYVVVAMDHTGNTLTDFFSDDQKVAEVALERPKDVVYAYKQACAESLKGGSPLNGMVDPSRVAMSGHSFGGWTALMIGGGQVPVTEAQAACASGAPSNIFCDYVGYWPAGDIVKVDPGAIPGLKALVALAPGGYSSFGEDGLDTVKVPGMIFGGTLDPTTPVPIEIDPIYGALPTPKYEVVLKDVSHMSFTNVCDIPLADQALSDYCGVEGMLEADDTFVMVNGLAVSFLDYYVKKIDAAHAYLKPEFVASFYPTAIYHSQEQ